MVLHGRLCGRVGRRRKIFQKPGPIPRNGSGLFFPEARLGKGEKSDALQKTVDTGMDSRILVRFCQRLKRGVGSRPAGRRFDL
jgi:hypothetical protein